jgi:hypothetical protein
MNVLRFVLLVVLMATLGCDDGRVKLPKAPVEGTVTYRGKPVAVGKIIFYHGSGQTAAASLAADGAFKLLAYQGTNQVAVQAYVKPNSTTDTDIGLGPFKNLVPNRYSEIGTSGLTFEVKPKDNDKAEFVLKD